ncbi:hypothetical protein LP420_31800 [Massilia sp. B-10]|nr:hypothetical protein LP420_31800 [Massilia sp. B-10]UUZ53328.1 hypothetical protein LP419_31325 [Massilia sp. H-1]
MSWLKYLDIEYLDEITFNKLSDFDINDPSDWSNIVEVAMRDEAINFNPVSRVSMIAVLDDLAGYPKSEVRRLLERVTMPFDAPLRDYISFFQYVRRELFDEV